ncbi:hypothetical protein [Lentibacillus sp. JNUCC-1]|uniref:hypothetical protein n=1 Tax=Lentibacillus sp. JNUCC-1 TaxID=2654513 RepID=UPI001E61D529|nr:hypothetical protein [Lentibacillus sp. JNUCC-1]
MYTETEVDGHKQLIEPYLERSIDQMLMFKRQFSNKVPMLALSAQMNEDVRAAASLWGTRGTVKH